MAIIYLRHPVHGSKVANMEAEAAYDEGRGWVRYDPYEVTLPTTPPEPEPEVVDVDEALAAPPEPEPANRLTRRRRTAIN